MKFIAVGDLHGDIELYRQIKSEFKDESLILMGDLLDSFHFSVTEQFNLMIEVLNDIERGEVRCIFGNHELSYLYSSMRCSGFNSYLYTILLPHVNRIHRLFENFIYDRENNLLITHAGLSQGFMNSCAPAGEYDLVEWLTQLLRTNRDLIMRAGIARGGSLHYGGIFLE